MVFMSFQIHKPYAPSPAIASKLLYYPFTIYLTSENKAHTSHEAADQGPKDGAHGREEAADRIMVIHGRSRR